MITAFRKTCKPSVLTELHLSIMAEKVNHITNETKKTEDGKNNINSVEIEKIIKRVDGEKTTAKKTA